MEQETRPTDTDAYQIAARYLGNEHFTISRFPTGLCHYVYEIVSDTQGSFVLRMGYAATREHLAGSIYWTEKLLPLNLPIPKILYHDISATFPYTILERIPGQDLGQVYPHLTAAQKRAIAQQVAHWQKQVSSLPAGDGFGYGFSHQDKNFKQSWYAVIKSQLERAREWIELTSIVDVSQVDRVEQVCAQYQSYFELIRPIPFLHDTTTKNVLVSANQFSGIVDIDDLCFGDPLFVVALTKMGLLSSSFDTDYITYWCQALNLSGKQLRVLDLYTALFCVTFMGEIGQSFNKQSVEVDRSQVTHYENILDSLLR